MSGYGATKRSASRASPLKPQRAQRTQRRLSRKCLDGPAVGGLIGESYARIALIFEPLAMFLGEPQETAGP